MRFLRQVVKNTALYVGVTVIADGVHHVGERAFHAGAKKCGRFFPPAQPSPKFEKADPLIQKNNPPDPSSSDDDKNNGFRHR